MLCSAFSLCRSIFYTLDSIYWTFSGGYAVTSSRVQNQYASCHIPESGIKLLPPGEALFLSVLARANEK